jgi:hypothetical protein
MQMRAFLMVLTMLGLFGLASCSKFKTYDGPEVTRVLVYKSSRTMYLMHHETPLAAHQINLGYAPEGDKEKYGDGKTPTAAITCRSEFPTPMMRIVMRRKRRATIRAEISSSMAARPNGAIWASRIGQRAALP